MTKENNTHWLTSSSLCGWTCCFLNQPLYLFVRSVLSPDLLFSPVSPSFPLFWIIYPQCKNMYFLSCVGKKMLFWPASSSSYRLISLFIIAKHPKYRYITCAHLSPFPLLSFSSEYTWLKLLLSLLLMTFVLLNSMVNILPNLNLRSSKVDLSNIWPSWSFLFPGNTYLLGVVDRKIIPPKCLHPDSQNLWIYYLTW